MIRRHDVTIPIVHGLAHYPGNPDIGVVPHSEIRHGASANVSSLTMGSHTGTHVDAPKHFDDAGGGVDSLPLDALIGPAVVLAFGDEVRSIGPAELEGQELAGRTRVLLRTRNSARQVRGEFFSDYVWLEPAGAEWLAARGVALVGIDYLSIEQFRSGHHRTHRTLFANDIVIVEGLALGAVPPGPYRLICLPLRIAGADGAPARVVLEEE